ncbi:MAG: HYR domain-containing protein, partial [Bacteroidota bacterium]|nr:HYR domain-containing protein [Bacteroidota bacterium]
TVLDTIKPVALISNNLNIYLNALGTATLTTAMVNNGSTDNCTIANMTLSKTAFTGADRGLNVVTFTVIDNSANTRAVNVNVNVFDTMRPIAVAQNLTIYLNALGTASVTASQVNNGSSDNVGITSMVLSQTSFGCSNTGANNVTLTVSDVSGNFSTAAAVITVLDTIKPVAIAQNLTVYLNTLGAASISTTQVNNGSSDNCSVSSITLSKSIFDCSNTGLNNVTMTVSDPSGNFRTVVSTITVLDTIRPLATINNNLYIYLNASATATLTTGMVNNGSSDNCAIASMTLSKTTFTGADRGLNIVTFTVTDNSSNSRAVNVNVYVLDTMRPIAIAQNRTIYLNGSGQASITAAQVNNGSTDNVGITSMVLNQSNFTCANVGVNYVTLTVSDASSNSSVATATITVSDTTRPVVIGKNLTIYTNQFGTASITAAMINNGSSDNCSISSYTLSRTDFECGHLGANQVDLTVTDPSNNIASATVTVTVLDTLKPIITVNNNLNIYLDSTGNVTLTPAEVDNGTIDNCAVGLRTISKTSFNGTNLGLNVITFTAGDPSNNNRTVNVNIYVRDSMVPVIKGRNLTIYLSAAGNASITTAMVDNGSTDNVNITSRTLSKSNFNCSNTGANQVIFTIRDGSGNESVGEVTITVLDTTKPALTSVPGNKIVGYCNNRITYSMPTGTDNCGNVSVNMVSGLASGTLYPLGLTTNTFELSDESGNKITTSFTVLVIPETVIDTFKSVEICQDHGTIDLSMGASASLTFNGAGVKKDKITFDPMLSGVGTHTITASFVDSLGCISTGSFTITVYPVPDKPEINRVASNVLQANKDFYSYQWYRNNVMIAGATSKSLTLTQSGVYGLVVKNTSGCVNGSDPYSFGVTGVSTMVKEKDMFNVYPNPSSGIFYIELKGIAVKGSLITIIDMLGKEVMHFEAQTDMIEMNVIDFAPGTYYVKLENGNKFMFRPLIIAK